MRKIVVFNRISLDGFYCRPNGDIDWFLNDPAVDGAAHELMSPDTILFGRVTYQQFEAIWPPMTNNPDVPEGARRIANELNNMTKVVFSATLQETTWENSKLVSTDLAREAGELKQGDGADIAVFGSGTVVQQLAGEGLVDEYLIVVTPVILGAGKPLFEGVEADKLTLLTTRDFASGNLLIHYGA